MLFLFGVILPMILTSRSDPKYVRYRVHKRVLVLDVIFLVIFLVIFCIELLYFVLRGV